MLRTVTIVPAILSADKQEYKSQIEKINAFTRRVQIDIADGIFTPNQTLDITHIWWPKTWSADLHLMVSKPSDYIETILKLHPDLCIFHAEATEELMPTFKTIKSAGIRVGLALLPSTYPGSVKQYIDMVDHVLIFAGKLGMQGGQADMMHMEKIPLVRNMKPELEIGWDGGVNVSNVRALAHADLDVINVGSAIAKSQNPAATFEELVSEIDKNGVML